MAIESSHIVRHKKKISPELSQIRPNNMMSYWVILLFPFQLVSYAAVKFKREELVLHILFSIDFVSSAMCLCIYYVLCGKRWFTDFLLPIETLFIGRRVSIVSMNWRMWRILCKYHIFELNFILIQNYFVSTNSFRHLHHIDQWPIRILQLNIFE